MKSISIYYLSSFLGLMAGSMFNYTIVIYSHSLSENERFAGIVFFTAYIPFLFLSWKAGHTLDHHSRKLVVGLSQVLSATSCLVPALLSASGLLHSGNRELLILFTLLSGVAMSFIMPGRLAILGDLARERLAQATMVQNVFMLLGFALAPILAGWLRQDFPFSILFLVNGLMYLASLGLLLFVRLLPAEPRETNVDVRAFLKTSALPRQILIALFLSMVIVGPIQVLLPKFGKEILLLGETARGILMGMLGTGLIAGAVIARRFAQVFHRGRILIAAISLSGFTFLGTALSTQPIPAALALVLAGICLGMITGFAPALLQEHTPNQVRGRVMSLFSLLFLLTPAVSGLAFAILADRLGTRDTLLVACASAILPGILAFRGLRLLTQTR